MRHGAQMAPKVGLVKPSCCCWLTPSTSSIRSYKRERQFGTELPAEKIVTACNCWQRHK
jgi:hypothetical protein